VQGNFRDFFVYEIVGRVSYPDNGNFAHKIKGRQAFYLSATWNSWRHVQAVAPRPWIRFN